MRRIGRREQAQGYALAIVASAGAILVRWLLGGATTLLYVTYYPAVMASAWWGGRGPALLSVLVCAVAADHWWARLASGVLPTDPRHYTNLLLFLVVGAAVGLVTSQLRRLQRRFRSVLEAIHDGFAIIDREWRFVYANPA